MRARVDKLYWVADQAPPQNIHNAFFFNIDNVSGVVGLPSPRGPAMRANYLSFGQDLNYMPFNKDFGPLNLSMTHRFCREL